MQLGETIAIGFLKEEMKAKCQFKESDEGVEEEEPENIEDDELDEVQEEQANNGGTLGDNLTKASWGKDGTVGGPFPPPEFEKKPQIDTKHQGGALKVLVKGADGIDSKGMPFVVAAHHLIPGNASLRDSDLKPYMTQNETVETEAGNTWTIKKFIGYNVNGCHNGVWLPGNYAIRKYKPATPKRKERPNTSPIGGFTGGINWGDMSENYADWQLNYVAAVVKVNDAQFHDSHEEYSEAVMSILNKIAVVLMEHQDNCQECKSKTKIPPPFMIKERLYALSNYLKTKLTSSPPAWKSPFLTSDRWRDELFSGNRNKYKKFLNAWFDARKVIID